MNMHYLLGTDYNYYATEDGAIISLMRNKPVTLTPKTNRHGYYQTSITYQGVRKTKEIHRLVYESFNGKIPVGYVIDHKDDNRLNNSISNLALMTQRENVMKARDSGRMENNRRAAVLNGKKRAKGFVKQSGIKHIYWNRKPQKWFGLKWVDGKRYSTGTFDEPNQALEALENLLS